MRPVVKRNRTVFFDNVVRTVLAFRRTRSDVRNVHEHFGLLVVKFLELLVEFVNLVAEFACGGLGFVSVFALLLEFANALGLGVTFALEAFDFGEERAALVIDGEHVTKAYGRIFLFCFSNIIFRIFTYLFNIKHLIASVENFFTGGKIAFF